MGAGPNNLAIIKMLLELWGKRVVINKRIILGWLDYDASRKDATLARTTGLQLMGVVLANHYPVYDPLYDGRLLVFSLVLRLNFFLGMGSSNISSSSSPQSI